MSNQNFRAALFSNDLYFKAFGFYYLSFKVKTGPGDVHLLDIISILHNNKSGFNGVKVCVSVASAICFDIE